MTTPPEPALIRREELKQRASALQLHGLLAHWDDVPEEQLPWLHTLTEWETVERKRRGLERRLSTAHIGRFKPLADFDWDWPLKCDKAAISELMTLHFIRDTANLILVGPNGVGKSMIAQNIAHHAVMQGYSALFINAAQMLGDLAAHDGDNALRRRLKHYAQPDLLVIDEVGYLSYGNRHADLLFNIINRRYVRVPAHDGHDPGPMADSLPAAWRTAFQPDGGHFGGRSGTVSAMISERCSQSAAPFG